MTSSCKHEFVNKDCIDSDKYSDIVETTCNDCGANLGVRVEWK